jgi:hypothetical protein
LENNKFKAFRHMSIEEQGVTLSFHTSPPFGRPFANTKPFANLDTSN